MVLLPLIPLIEIHVPDRQHRTTECSLQWHVGPGLSPCQKTCWRTPRFAIERRMPKPTLVVELQPEQAGGLVAKHVLLGVGRVYLQEEQFA